MSELEEKLKVIYGDDLRLSRIYLCKDGRRRIDIITDDSRKTVQLAKAVLEAKLGRKLIGNETVDHIDGDKTNDDPSNVRVLSRAANAADSSKRLVPQQFECPQCKVVFELTGRKLHHAADNRNKGKAGPFCNRSCAGKYGAEYQNGRTEKLKVTGIERKHYTNKAGMS